MLRCRNRRLRTDATPAGIGGVGLLLTVFVGACGGQPQHDVKLPTTAASTTPGVPASPASDEEAVRANYMRYWAVLPNAERTSGQAQRRALLADYATDPQLSTVLRNINNLHATHQTSWGYVVVHIEDIHINGGTATVTDCQDTSHAGLKDAKSGKKTSRGVPRDPLRATLTRGTDGRWRINGASLLKHC